MAADVMTGLCDLFDGVRVLLGAARIDEERAGNAVPLEEMHDPPHANAAAIGRPGLAGVIHGAGLEMGRLHRVGRRLVVRPSLEHHGHGDRDLLAVGPSFESSLSDCHRVFCSRLANGGVIIRSRECPSRE